MSEQEMIKICKSCGKEFQNLSEGVLYSSSAVGFWSFAQMIVPRIP
jgi:transposase-like protein